MNQNQIKILVVAIVAIVALVVFNPIELISEGNRGLKFTLGKIQNETLQPGIHFRMPLFQNIEELTIQPIEYKKEIDVDANGAITKDKQTIGASIKVFYKYNEDELVSMWKNYGVSKIESLVIASITESFKVVIGEYDIFKLPESRDIIRESVLKIIKQKMAEYPVSITSVNILNFDWSDEFDRQIEATMQRAQQVKQKEQELLIAEQEAQKQVKVAEAEKTALVTKAEGERDAAKLQAEAKDLEGQGIAKYNKSILSTLQIEIKLRELEIEKIKAEKWNGQYVPNNMYGPIPVDTAGGVKGN